MPFSLAELIDVLSLDPTDATNRGKLRAIRMEKIRSDEYLLSDLFDQLAAAPSQPMPPRLERVPWADVSASHESRRQPLGAVEVAFVQLIAAKPPADVTIDEARRLAKLAADAAMDSTGSMASMDSALLEAAFRPIRELHETRVEAANRALLASVRRVAVPELPPRAMQLLGDAIAAENPALRPNEAAARAREVIAEVNARRTGQEPSGEPLAARTTREMAEARHSGLTGEAAIRY